MSKCYDVCLESNSTMQDVEDLAFETESWANRVASACIERYNALPRAGKPGANEWAPLAGIVAFVPVSTAKNSASNSERLISKAQDHSNCDLGKACDEMNPRSINSAGGHASSIVNSSLLNEIISSSPSFVSSNVIDTELLSLKGMEMSTIEKEFTKNNMGKNSSEDQRVIGNKHLRDVQTDKIEITSCDVTAIKEDIAGAKESVESYRKCTVTSSISESMTYKTETKRNSRETSQGKTSPEGVVTCVALGTGSKCLGGNELACGGVRVHDSHAEVLARRGFLRYLLHQAERALTTGDSSLLEAGPAGCQVRQGVSFHAFVSEPPCGDAAIFPSDEHAQRTAKAERLGKRRRDEEDRGSETSIKRIALRSSKSETIGENIQIKDVSLARADTAKDPTITKNFKIDVDHKQIISNLGEESSNNHSYQPEKINSLQNVSQEIFQDSKRSSVLSFGGVKVNPTTVQQDSSTLTSNNSENKPTNTFTTESLSTDENLGKVTQTSSQDSITEVQKSNHVPNEMENVTATDVHRTGAKCVGGGTQDTHAPGVGYHVTGAVRTKPGRGDPTLSLSCSDKMARWHVVGVQGALLSLILPAPVRFRSVVHAGGVTWSAASLRRALVERTCTDLAPLALVQAALPSPAGRSEGARPCAAGVVWCDLPQRPHEVVARGLKQGVTKKAASTSAGRLKICRKEMAKEFIRVYSSALAQYPKLRLNASCLDKRLRDFGCGIFDLESLESRSDAQNCLESESPPVECVILEGQNMQCRNCISEKSCNENTVCALNSVAGVDSSTVDNYKCNACLAKGEFLIGSGTSSIGINVSIRQEESAGITYCGQQSGKEEIISKALCQMTYAQLKVMACDYQRRWQHVRESHFPGWTTKPSGLKDFVIDDEYF